MAASAAQSSHQAAAPPVALSARDSAEEREADRIAEVVIRGGTAAAAMGGSDGTAPKVYRQCAACASGGTPCASCAEDETEEIHLKADGSASRVTDGGGFAAQTVKQGHGAPLSDAMRSYFEPRFGADLSDVRIHTDTQAGLAARTIGARAFAYGSDIAFASNAFDTNSLRGRRLLAHELAHVTSSNGGHADGLIRRQNGEHGDEEEQAPSQGFVVLSEQPITFEGYALGPEEEVDGTTTPYAPVSGLAPASNVLAAGEHVWTSPNLPEAQARRLAARRVLRPEYWAPMLPRSGTQDIDRLLGTLPRSLEHHPRPANWAQGALGRAGLSQAELDSVPDLIRRWNAQQSGGPPLSPREFQVLQTVADLHVGGTPPGSPVISYTTPDPSARPDLSWRNPRFRVRVEFPSADVLDVSVPGPLSQGAPNLPNATEVEFLIATNEQGRIVNVQRIDAPDSAPPGFLMRNANKIRWGGRALFVLDMARAGHRISTASDEERPAVIGEEAGGQVGGWVGTGAAVAGCVAFGIATGGVGLFVCGLVGGVAGSTVGSAVGRGLVESSNSAGEGVSGGPCPSCHAMQREWQQNQAFPNPSSNLLQPQEPAGPEQFSPEDAEMLRRWLEEVQ